MENQNQKTINMSTNQDMLTGMFHDRESTENAYRTLQEKGYAEDEINILMSGDTLKKQFSNANKHTEFGTYTTINALNGPTIDSIDYTVVDVIGANGRSVIIRGNVIILVGPIASGITGTGASGIPGGIIAALIDSGFSKESANIYDTGIKRGHIVLGVKIRSEEDAKYIKNDWRTNKVEGIHI